MSWQITRGSGPLVATAIHAGHLIRPDVLDLLAVDEQTRLREEDPYTDRWTGIAPNRIIVTTSRFELDLNRPPQKAVYLTADDAWGIDVWKTAPPEKTVRESMTQYERFYNEIDRFLTDVRSRHGDFIVLDLHSYCHRRGGPDSPPDDPALNPDINLGTESIDKRKWSRVLERFIDDLRAFDTGARPLDVRENVRFKGGHFPSWINKRFADNACAMAIEVKKTFMDEWTGMLDSGRFEVLEKALGSAVQGLLEELGVR